MPGQRHATKGETVAEAAKRKEGRQKWHPNVPRQRQKSRRGDGRRDLRPAMYVGSNGEKGLNQIVYEVVDNSVDEALAGYATAIDVTIHIDNSITVVDDGRGIPVDDMVIDGEKVSEAQVWVTTLHADGTFDRTTYKATRR